MFNHLLKISLSCLLIVSVAIVSASSFSFPAQALESENQPYFIKQIEKDKVLAVSPNFRGELTQTSLLPSLTEISHDYHIKGAKAIQAEKLNGKLVPGLIVYVEAKSPTTESGNMLANNF